MWVFALLISSVRACRSFLNHNSRSKSALYFGAAPSPDTFSISESSVLLCNSFVLANSCAAFSFCPSYCVQPREAVVRVRLRRIQLNGMLQGGDSFLIPVLVGIDATEIEVGQPVFTLQLKRLL